MPTLIYVYRLYHVIVIISSPWSPSQLAWDSLRRQSYINFQYLRQQSYINFQYSSCLCLLNSKFTGVSPCLAPGGAFSAVRGSSFQNVSHWSALFFLFTRSYGGQIAIFFPYFLNY